jgi:hypothetical protein
MLRSGRFADEFVGHQALHERVIDHFIVDAVTNCLLNVGEYGVLLFHRSIISRGWRLQPLRPPANGADGVEREMTSSSSVMSVGMLVGEQLPKLPTRPHA